MGMSSILEQVNLKSDVELISDLILLERRTGEKLEFKDLCYYIPPVDMLKLMKLLPWDLGADFPPA